MKETKREDELREFEKLNAYIAEHLMGFYPPEHEVTKVWRIEHGKTHSSYDGYWLMPSRFSLVIRPPRYISNMDLARVMETRIKELGLELEYAVALAEIVGRKAGLAAQYNEFDLLHASASERCRAARMLEGSNGTIR
jgi:hypothetical protein